MRNSRYLFAALEVAPAIQIKTFLNSIGGPLGTAVRQSAELNPPASLDDAFAIATRRARQLDDFASSGFAGVFAAPQRQLTAAPTRASASALSPRAERLESQAQASTHLQPLTPEERARLLREGCCLRCRQRGHATADCRGPGRSPKPPTPARTIARETLQEASARTRPSSEPASAKGTAAPGAASRSQREKRPPARLQDYDLTGSRLAPQVMAIATETLDPALDLPELLPSTVSGDTLPVACMPNTHDEAASRAAAASSVSAPNHMVEAARIAAVLPDDRPAITLTLDLPGKPSLRCVPDTGACVSLMSETLAAELGCTPRPRTPLVVIFGNDSRTTLDRADTLDPQLTSDAPKRPVTFLVAKNSPPGPYALLGRPDLAGFVIAFDSPVPRLSWGGQPPIEDLADPLDLPGEPQQVMCAADGTPEVRLGNKLTPDEVPLIKEILREFADCFGPLEAQPADLPAFTIKLKPGATPVAARPRRLNEEKRRLVDAEIDRLLALGIIKPSSSPWAAPLVIAVNRFTGKPRVCYDYKALNAQTLRDAYPIPATADIVQWFSGKPYLASFDMSKGYMQTPLASESQPLMAFIGPLSRSWPRFPRPNPSLMTCP